MPHRVTTAHITLVNLFEFFGLTVAAIVASINGLIDEASWDRLTGRHGALFVMAIALIIFWNSNRLREKRDAARQALIEKREDERREHEEAARQTENEARELRHKEAMALQHSNSEKITSLTVEGVKAQGMVATALHDFSDKLNDLTNKLKDCPKQQQ